MNDPLQLVCPHCHATNRLPANRLADGGRCGRCHRALFTGEPITLDEASFDLHSRRSDVPLVVDFWAPWCGPCRMMAPGFARAAQVLEPRFRLAKLNTEELPELASRFGIRSIPTLVVIRHGSEMARHAGAMDVHGIVRWVSAHQMTV